MKRVFLGVMLSLFAMVQSFAVEFIVDGINYAIKGFTNTCMVASNAKAYGSIVIPESVTHNGSLYNVVEIGNEAFRDCYDLTSVVIPNSVTRIGDDAFSGCSLTELGYVGLTSVTMGNSVKSIGERAFCNCSGLTSIIIPNSVKSIGRSAFYGCKSLTSIYIPNSVESIGEGAFAGCSGLTFFEIPNSVTRIGDDAFYKCSGLTSINIPNSVTSIGGSAFYKCSGLTSINIPNSVTSIGGSAFRGCSGLTSATLGNSVTSIGDYAFSGCYALTSIDIPNSVTSIEYATFSSCQGLTSVTIGNSVKRIADDVFWDSKNLQTLKVYMDTPASVTGDTFRGVDKSKCVLYVPKGSLKLYYKALGWSGFKNMRELSEEETAAKSTLADSGIKVFGKGMNIIVKGALESAPVKVSGTDGVTLRNATGNGTITMDTKGIYVVTVGDQTFKVWL